MNNEFFQYTNSNGIGLKPREAYNPQSNGIVENRMQHIQNYFRKFVNEQASNWAH